MSENAPPDLTARRASAILEIGTLQESPQMGRRVRWAPKQ
jgi:hypothetical protein